MQVDIQDASTNDLDELQSIELACFGKEAFTRQQIANLLTDYNSITLIAKINGKPAGFIIASIHEERHSFAGHILTVDVSDRYQRRGVGFALMKAVESIFKNKKVKQNHLEVREDNLAALRLYEKLGYERVGELKNYYGTANGIYLVKKL